MGRNHGRAMTVTKERKRELIQQYRRAESDSGSPEVQIAVATARINNLTEHMRTHEKDYASRRGLLALVSRRRTLLDYLRRVNPQGYLDIINKLGIRKEVGRWNGPASRVGSSQNSHSSRFLRTAPVARGRLVR
jgi:small subunit ribosomal protein S15